jgi:hypothetical protein
LSGRGCQEGLVETPLVGARLVLGVGLLGARLSALIGGELDVAVSDAAMGEDVVRPFGLEAAAPRVRRMTEMKVAQFRPEQFDAHPLRSMRLADAINGGFVSRPADLVAAFGPELLRVHKLNHWTFPFVGLAAA